MEFVSNKEEIIENIKLLESYLHSNNKEKEEFASNLVRRGKTLVVYKVNGEDHFAPSRFIGYKSNNMENHIQNDEKDGRDTNPVITEIIGKPYPTSKLDEKFIIYCNKLNIKIQYNKKKYWRLRDSNGKYLNIINL